MKDLQNILKFTKLLNEFRKIERVIRSNGGDRLENDVEHSYQLTMLAWYIISTQKLDLNLDLVIKYSLVHDLVEIYAGDTYAHTTDSEFKKSKIKREEESLVRLESEFKEFPEIFELIKQYESKSDAEAKFIYALDKIEPILNIYTSSRKMWKEKNVSIDMIIDIKKDKVKLDPEVEKLFYKIIKTLKEEEKDLFN
ncbi:MAG: HD domain-containing protein [Candidatus Pacebacteria bacterium]|nr:HD domain-containing protein [Candidatus Paceibacterota bacterium]